MASIAGDLPPASLEEIQSPIDEYPPRSVLDQLPQSLTNDAIHPSAFGDSPLATKDEKPSLKEEEEKEEEEKEEEKEEEEEDPVSSSTPSKSASPKKAVVEGVEDDDVDALHLSGLFFSLEDRLPAPALDLIYWRQPAISGGVFGSLFLILLAFAAFSAISVVSYLGLILLTATFSYVLFKRVAAAVQKSGEEHPFQHLLDHDMETVLRYDHIQDVVKASIGGLLPMVDVLRNLFLLVNMFDSFKLGLFLYAMTYVGEAFNLLTLFIVALLLLFTVPKTYEIYGDDLDLIAEKLVAQGRAQWPVIKEQVVDRIMMLKEKAIAAIPIGKDKAA